MQSSAWVSAQGVPSAWTYTALGDSIAAGVSATTGYPELYRGALEAQIGVPIEVVNLACPGCTTADLLSSLQDDPRFRDSVARSQIVSWNIGGNDLLGARAIYLQRQCGGADGQDCLRATVARFERNWDSILEELAALTAGRPVVLVTMDMYDPFVRGEGAPGAGGAPSDLVVFQPYLDEVNAYIATTASAREADVAAVHSAFNGPSGSEDPLAKGLIASDFIHPTDAGQQRLVDLLLESGRAQVQQVRAALQVP